MVVPKYACAEMVGTRACFFFFFPLLPRCGHDTGCTFFLFKFITLVRARVPGRVFPFHGAVRKCPALHQSNNVKLGNIELRIMMRSGIAVTPSYHLTKVRDSLRLNVTALEGVGKYHKARDVYSISNGFLMHFGA